ncbi:MAG: prolyl oligopeptidase family serine peptidase [Pseudomonadota bacterium]
MAKLTSSLAALAMTLCGPVLADCGPSPDACEVEGGTYHLRLPDGDTQGAIMFLHGWGSSGAASLGNRRWVPQALAAGYAVIAPNGMPREGRNGRRWNFHPDWPQDRDDIAFLQNVRDDAAARFDLDPGGIALGGFSIGGSMTHYVACAVPDAFAAYIPVAGAFWRPDFERCAGPVRLLHTHGWRDTTVPLEGRVVRGADVTDPEAWAQGDVFHAMRLWRIENGCVQLRADRFDTDGPFWRRAWDRCTQGTALELALFDGGHTVPAGWIDLALGWLNSLER